MMIIGSSNILFSLSASRLPKPGDDPRVQGARGDFGRRSLQAIENKQQRNCEPLSTTRGCHCVLATTRYENGNEKRILEMPRGISGRIRSGASSPFVNLAGRFGWYSVLLLFA